MASRVVPGWRLSIATAAPPCGMAIDRVERSSFQRDAVVQTLVSSAGSRSYRIFKSIAKILRQELRVSLAAPLAGRVFGTVACTHETCDAACGKHRSAEYRRPVAPGARTPRKRGR